MYQSRGNKKSKRKSSLQRCENKSTQTERPANTTATINGSVILNITDYTKFEDEDRSSVDETSVSDASSHLSAFSETKRRKKALVSIANCASQTDKGWRNSIVSDFESSSDSDDTEQINTTSYAYLEGEPLVTSLANLQLSESEEDPQQQHVIEITSNEEKLAKFL